MTLIETVKLPGTADRAWALLAANGGALRLAPGLAVGEEGRGTLRIVLGGHSVTYRGYARQHVEEEGRHLTWTLSGKEVRGTGRAHAEVRARFRDEPEGGCDLRLTVLVEGRGRLGEVSEAEVDRAVRSVIARFRRALTQELQAAAPSRGRERPLAPTRPTQERSEGIPSEPVRRVPGAVEVAPPSTAVRRWLPPGGAIAAGALILGLAALLFRRYHRRG